MTNTSKKRMATINDFTAYKLNNPSMIYGGTGGVVNMAIAEDSTTTTSDKDEDKDGDC